MAVSRGKESNSLKGIDRSLNIFVSHLFLSRVPRKASKHLSIQPSSALLSLTGHFHLANAPTSQSGRIVGLGGIMGRRGRGFVLLLALPPCCPPACDPCPSSSPTAPPPLPLPITSEGSARPSGLLQECCRRGASSPTLPHALPPNCISACSLGYLDSLRPHAAHSCTVGPSSILDDTVANGQTDTTDCDRPVRLYHHRHKRALKLVM